MLHETKPTHHSPPISSSSSFPTFPFPFLTSDSIDFQAHFPTFFLFFSFFFLSSYSRFFSFKVSPDAKALREADTKLPPPPPLKKKNEPKESNVTVVSPGFNCQLNPILSYDDMDELAFIKRQ